jgi:hypothetical protein
MIPLSYSLLVYIDREGDDDGVGTSGSARGSCSAGHSSIKGEVDEFNYEWFYWACNDDDLD